MEFLAFCVRMPVRFNEESLGLFKATGCYECPSFLNADEIWMPLKLFFAFKGADMEFKTVFKAS